MNVEIGNGYSLRDWPSAWNDGDQDRWVALADEYDIWVNLAADSFPHPYTRRDAEEWVALQSSKDPSEHFAVCDAAGPVGGIGIRMHEDDSRRSAELGYLFGKPFWGRGIMTAAARAVTAYGFETLDLERIFARVKVSNKASARVLEKAGFQRQELARDAVSSRGEPSDYRVFIMLRDD